MLKHYYQADAHIGNEAFHQLLGWTPPNPLWDRKAKLGYNDTIAQGKYKKGFGKLLYIVIVVLLAKKFLFFIRKPLLANNVMFVMNK